MKCQRAQQRLMAYHDSELSEGGTRRLHRHLESCDECSRLLKGLQLADERASTSEGVNEVLGVQDMPPPGDAYWEGFTGRVLDRVEEDAATRAPARKRARGGWNLFIPKMAPAFSIALVVVVAAGVLMKIGDPTPVVKTPAPVKDSRAPKETKGETKEDPSQISLPEGDVLRGQDAGAEVDRSLMERTDGAVNGSGPEAPAVQDATSRTLDRVDMPKTEETKADTGTSSREAAGDMDRAGRGSQSSELKVPDPEVRSSPAPVKPGASGREKAVVAGGKAQRVEPPSESVVAAPGLDETRGARENAAPVPVPPEEESALAVEKADKLAAPPSGQVAEIEPSVTDRKQRGEAESDDAGSSLRRPENSSAGVSVPPEPEEMLSSLRADEKPDTPITEGPTESAPERTAAVPVESFLADSPPHEDIISPVPAKDSLKSLSDTARRTSGVQDTSAGKGTTYSSAATPDPGDTAFSGVLQEQERPATKKDTEQAFGSGMSYRGPQDQLTHAKNLADVRKFWESEQVLKDLLAKRPPSPIQQEASLLLVKVLTSQNRIVEAQRTLDDAKTQFPSDDVIQSFEIRSGNEKPVQ